MIQRHTKGSEPAALQKLRLAQLFFILATLLESNAGARFPFGAFKREKWDIKHIRSMKSGMPARTDAQKRWLEDFEKFVSGNGSRVELGHGGNRHAGQAEDIAADGGGRGG